MKEITIKILINDKDGIATFLQKKGFSGNTNAHDQLEIIGAIQTVLARELKKVDDIISKTDYI